MGVLGLFAFDAKKAAPGRMESLEPRSIVSELDGELIKRFSTAMISRSMQAL